ncbi:exonuclease SbcCD subunit D [Clostridiaceae bacterium]|nr:exonuclease SbcCD subunit D [Clostridiaceae bacterium]
MGNVRILHTGDLHFGASIGGFSLLPEQEALVEMLLKIVTEQSIDAAVLTGDIFDRAVSTSEAIALYDRFLTALCRQCPVYLIAGNHDGAARLASLAGLLRGAGLYVQGSLREKPQPIRQDDAEFWLIPYFNAEQVRLLYPDAGIRSANDAMRALMDDVRARRNPAACTIVAAHCFVTGASPSGSDTSAVLAGAGRVGADVFQDIPYTALGHLHRAQQPAPNVRYSGSPYPYSFSEGEKSVTIFDTATRQITEIPLHHARTLRTVRGTFDEVLALPTSEDYLQIELTDRGAGLETLDTLRARFPRLVTLLGRQAAGGEATTLTVEELRTLSHRPADLVGRFCEEIGGSAAQQEHITLFLELLREIQEGGGGQ